ncbi:MAG TPA: carboxypeptidase-like regulatory domain-containing protein, partial [Vicinamibacterales bacterium]|nr:carboxypeptidase-like regulatory domain-containing protein [Vicinamibacterales bacterium]
MRVIVRVAILSACTILFSTAAFAQGILTGVVRDASGGVLPGVSVEAASPALIEKVRTAVTDGSGQYRIEDLRPGSYTVTMSLTGFSTFKREGIELTGGLTITVNADLKVGAVAETVTVTGETPVVDVQSAKRETTLSNQVV